MTFDLQHGNHMPSTCSAILKLRLIGLAEYLEHSVHLTVTHRFLWLSFLR